MTSERAPYLSSRLQGFATTTFKDATTFLDSLASGLPAEHQAAYTQLKADVLQTLRFVHHSTSFLLETKETWARLRLRAWDRTLHRVRKFQRVREAE